MALSADILKSIKNRSDRSSNAFCNKSSTVFLNICDIKREDFSSSRVFIFVNNIIFDGIQNFQDYSISLFPLIEGVDFIFRVTPLGSIFSLVASSLWILASIYTIGYMRGAGEDNQTRFVIFYSIAIHAALAIAWSGNLLVLFIFYEILTFSTFPLVGHKQNVESQAAGRVYLSILVGTSLMLFLPAIFWIWFQTGTLDFRSGGILEGRFPTEYLSFLVALLVFGIGKAAIMPLMKQKIVGNSMLKDRDIILKLKLLLMQVYMKLLKSLKTCQLFIQVVIHMLVSIQSLNTLIKKQLLMKL